MIMIRMHHNANWLAQAACRLLPLLLAIGFLLTCVHGAPNKLVRLNLERKIGAQKGPLGQPLVSYSVRVAVGTPPKKFSLMIDLNARETWLPHYSHVGRLLGRLNYKDGYLKKESSSGVKEEKEIYNVAYKTTELSGKAYTDWFQFLDVTESMSEPKLKQRFLAMSSASNDNFMNYGVDGVLAINPWPVSETGSEMLLVGLARAKLTGELKVGLSLEHDEDSKSGGEITFGGFNPTKFIGALRFHSVVSQHSWEVNLNNVMLGHQSITCATSKYTALISTTANEIYGPVESVVKVLQFFGHSNTTESNFDNERLYSIDCLKVADAPSITIVIDDAYYVLHPTAYIRKRTEGVLFKSQSCYIGILSDGSGNRWKLGTNFLSNYYTVLDLNKRGVAFAMRK